MSKRLRPTFICDCGGTLIAGCWVVGFRDVTYREGRPTRVVGKGHWEMACDKCKRKGEYTP